MNRRQKKKWLKKRYGFNHLKIAEAYGMGVTVKQTHAAIVELQIARRKLGREKKQIEGNPDIHNNGRRQARRENKAF